MRKAMGRCVNRDAMFADASVTVVHSLSYRLRVARDDALRRAMFATSNELMRQSANEAMTGT